MAWKFVLPGRFGQCVLAVLLVPGVLAAAEAPPRPAKANVTTYHNDVARTGQNLQETVLTPDLVAGKTPGKRFAKLWSVSVDGQVYGQPLCLCDVPVRVSGQPAAKQDLVLVATQHNSIYAFEATQGELVWQWSGITATLQPIPSDPYDEKIGLQRKPQTNLLRAYDIIPEVGITGTPVIDPEARRMYFVTKSRDTSATLPANGSRYVQRIHCLDITTGREAVPPTVIQATYPGSGSGIDDEKPPPSTPDDIASFNSYVADAGYDPQQGTYIGDNTVGFLPKCQNQRPGLLLLDGVVYIGWSSHGDQGAYHGWLIGYDAKNLQQVSVFNVTPNGYEGAIWQGGAAPAADEQGNIYVATGNGSFNARGAIFDGQTNFGNSVLKISTRGRTLRVLDYFTPFDYTCLNAKDMDLGSGGVIVLPKQPGDPRLLLAVAGKSGIVYLLDREHMGQQVLKNVDYVVRRIPHQIGTKFGTGAYFDGSIYFGGGDFTDDSGNHHDSSPIKRLSLATALDQPRPDFDAATNKNGTPIVFALKGTNPSISANDKSQAILWTLRADGNNEPSKQVFQDPALYRDPSQKTYIPPAVLYAFDAKSLNLLWASGDQDLGDRIKFSVPTIANGRVYVGTQRLPQVRSPGPPYGGLTAFGVHDVPGQ